MKIGEYFYDKNNNKVSKNQKVLKTYEEYKEFLDFLWNFKFEDNSIKYRIAKNVKIYTILKDLVKPLPFKVSENLSYSLRDILDFKIDYDVFLENRGVNLQRDFVWTISQKQEFIKSFLKEVYLPPICIIATNHTNWEIIDGKQRLSSLLSFLNNEFPLELENSLIYFKDLDKFSQSDYLGARLSVNVAYQHGEITEDMKIDWFLKINFAGTPQEIEHFNKLKNK